MDPDTFLTTTYVIVDDLCQAKSGEVRPKRRGRNPMLSESEVITLALLSQWHGRGRSGSSCALPHATGATLTGPASSRRATHQNISPLPGN